MPVTVGGSLALTRLVTPFPYVYNAEKVPLGVGEHHERRSNWVGPIDLPRTEPDQAVYLGDQLLVAVNMQVQVHAIAPVQGDRGALGLSRDENRRFVLVGTSASDPITESRSPELSRSVHVRDVDDD